MGFKMLSGNFHKPFRYLIISFLFFSANLITPKSFIGKARTLLFGVIIC